MPRKKPSVKKVNAGSWAKNVGKSFGTMSADIIKDMMPGTYEIVDSAKDPLRELSNNLKEMKGKKPNARLESLMNDKLKKSYQVIQDSIPYVKEDLKSGNLYNKQRAQDIAAKSMGLDDFDLDFDFDSDDDFSFDDDLGDDSFDIDFDSDNSKDSTPTVVMPNVTINSNINADNPMVKALQQTNATLVETTKASAEQSAHIASVSMVHDANMVNRIESGLMTINDNLSLLVQFHNDNTNKLIVGSLQYFEDSRKMMTEWFEKYKETQGVKPGNALGYYGSDKVDPLDAVKYGFNLESYFNIVKDNIKRYKEDNLFISQISNMAEDSETLASMLSNPVGTVMKSVATSLIPGLAKKAVADMDKSLSALPAALLMQITGQKDNYYNPIMQVLGQVLGLNVESSRHVNTANFERGPMPFNGITQKYITEVIPGYLAKMTAALTGEDPLVYDIQNGKFKKYSKLSNEMRDEARRTTLNEYDHLGKIKERVNAYSFADDRDKQRILDRIDDLFINITNSEGFVNPFIEGSDDELKSLMKGATQSEIDFIRGIFKSMPNFANIETFGTNAFSAKRAQSDYYKKLSNDLGTNSFIYNGLFAAEEAELNKKREAFEPAGNIRLAHKGMGPTDQYGHTTLGYLRDIKSLLTRGIPVFNLSKGKIPQRVKELDDIGKKMTGEADAIIKNQQDKKVTRKTELSSYDKIRGAEFIESLESAGFSSDQVAEQMKKYSTKNEHLDDEYKDKWLLKKVRSILSGNAEDRDGALGDIVDRIMKQPKKLMSSMVHRVDKLAYDMVFGMTNEQGEHKSFIATTLDKIYNKSQEFYKKGEEFLFGEDGLVQKANEMLERFKRSQFFEDTKKIVGKAADWLFGKKDDSGHRRNGMFSDIANSFIDIGKGMRYFFDGAAYTDSQGVAYEDNPNSVFGEMNTMFGEFKTTMKEYFFVDGNGTKGAIATGAEALTEGFQTFATAMFGEVGADGKRIATKDIDMKEYIEVVKKRAPKSIAMGIYGAGAGAIFGGQLGLLGSLFLPGGPVGGAVVGTAIGFLSQSDKFNDWLFGPRDLENNNERIGGIINKQTQQFLKDHKSMIVGGAAVGTLKGMLGFGILPGFILGGPISGAILGAGTSMLIRSNKFQDFFFGKMDEQTNERAGGLLSKITGKAGSGDAKKKLGTIGAGILGGIGVGTVLSQFGILGGLAFGPVSGALLGAAAGITLTSEKWTKAVFGVVKEDEDGKAYREGGLLTRLNNFLEVEVLQPMKIKLLETKFDIVNWFDENVKETFLDIFTPVKVEVGRLTQRIHGLYTIAVDAITASPLVKGAQDHVITPIMDGFHNYVFEPFKRATNALFEGAKNLVGNVAAMPFRLLRFAIGDRLAAKHGKEGILAVGGMIAGNIKKNFEESPMGQTIIATKDAFVSAASTVTDFAKKGLQSTFDFGKKVISGLAKLTFNTITGFITAPFKLAKKGIDSLRSKPKQYGDGSSSRIADIRSGNRSGGQSIIDMIDLINPFSELHRDAKVTKEGAWYMSSDQVSTRDSERAQRAELRAKKREEQQKLLGNLREQSDHNKQIAKMLGYNNVDGDGKDVQNVYKDMNKQFSKEYGKGWTKLSKAEQDEFKAKMAQRIAQFEIKDNTTKILDVIQNAFKSKGAMFQAVADANSTVVDAMHDFNENAMVTDPTLNRSDDKMGNVGAQMKAAIDADQAEEKEKAKDAERKDKGDAAQAKVSSNTIDKVQAARTAKEEKSWWRKTFTKLVDNTSEIKDSSKEHTFNWASIFSKKGLITGAAIVLLPLLYNVLKDPARFLSGLAGDIGRTIVDSVKDLLGFGDDDGQRTDASGNIITSDDTMERLTMGGMKLGAAASKTITNVSQLLKGVHPDDIAGGASKFQQGTAKLIQGGKNIAGYLGNVGLGTSVDGSKNTISGMIDSFIKESGKAIKNAEAWLTSKVAGIDNKAIRTILGALSKVAMPSTLAKFSDKIAKPFASGMLKVGTGLATAGVGTIVFGTYGAITGYSDAETAKLFGIDQSNVTKGMKRISSIVKAFFSTGWFFILDILNDICVNLTGFDAIRALVDAIYAAFTSEEDMEKLYANRDKFEAGHAEYIDLASQVGLDTDLSLDAYNDKVNRGFFGKATDAVGGAFGTAKRFVFGNDGDSVKYQQALELQKRLEAMDGTVKSTEAYQLLLKENEEALVTYAESQNLLTRMGDVASKAFGSIGNFFKDSFSNLVDAGQEIIGYANVDDVPLSQIFTAGKPKDKGIGGAIKTAAFYLIRGVMSIGKVIGSGFDAVGRAVESLTKSTEGIISKGTELIREKAPIVAETYDKVKDVAGSAVDGAKNLWSNIKTGASNLWNKLGFGGGVGGEVQTNMLSKYNVTSNYGKRNITGQLEGHSGVDLSGGNNFPIESFTAGKVVKVVNKFMPDSGSVNSKDGGGFGNHVIVKNDDGTYSYYAHLNKVGVTDGQTVSPGQIIGLQGHTGRSTGSHLHYEVRQSMTKGSSIDPVAYLKSYKTGVPYQAGDVNSTEFTTGTEPTATGLAGFVESMSNVMTEAMSPFNQILSSMSGVVSSALGHNTSTGSTSSGMTYTGTSGNRIGDSVKKFESGSSGPLTISGGKGDYGGVSFGTYQFPTYGKTTVTSGNLYNFWNRFYANQYPGITPGNNQAFKNAWKDAVNRNPEQFAANEWAYIKELHYDPQVRKLSGILNPDTHSRAAQDMVWSAAVQYGPNTNVIKAALNGRNAQSMSVSDLINTVYDYKINSVGSYFKGSSQAVRNSVANRFKNEKQVLLALTGSPFGASIANSDAGGIGGAIIDFNRYKETHGVGGTPMTAKYSRDIFANTIGSRGVGGISYISDVAPSSIKAVGSENTGDATQHSLTEKVIDVLNVIATNTGNTNDNIDRLNRSETEHRNSNNTSMSYADNVTNNNTTIVNANNNNTRSAMYDIAAKRRSDSRQRQYNNAKNIARGIS